MAINLSIFNECYKKNPDLCYQVQLDCWHTMLWLYVKLLVSNEAESEGTLSVAASIVLEWTCSIIKVYYGYA